MLQGHTEVLDRAGETMPVSAYHYFVYGMSLYSEIPLALPDQGYGELGQIELRFAPASFFSEAARSLSATAVRILLSICWHARWLELRALGGSGRVSDFRRWQSDHRPAVRRCSWRIFPGLFARAGALLRAGQERVRTSTRHNRSGERGGHSLPGQQRFRQIQSGRVFLGRGLSRTDR